MTVMRTSKSCHIRIFILALAMLGISALTSCGDSKDEHSLYNRVMTMLGFDMNDYESEAVIRFPDESDGIWDEVNEIISILVYDSADITPFETTRGAAEGNCDAILNYMLKTSYSAYSGNAALLEKAVEAYPQYNITTLIPKADYESCVYRYFGGDSSVRHNSSVRFTFLPKVEAYTTTGQPISSEVEIDVTKCVETAHTYRIDFTLTDKEGDSVNYHAMIMKREDGTRYMKYLKIM